MIFLFVHSKDLKDSQTWSIYVGMWVNVCVCACTVHVMNIYSMRTLCDSFSFKLSARFCILACCCFDVFFFFTFFFQMKSTFTMAFQCRIYQSALYDAHALLTFGSSFHRSFVRWFQLWTWIRNPTHCDLSIAKTVFKFVIWYFTCSPILYVRLWLSSPKWFPLFLVNFGFIFSLFSAFYLGEMNWNPLHIWREYFLTWYC